MSSNLTTNDYRELKLLLDNNDFQINELRELYLELDPESSEFRFLTKALIGSKKNGLSSILVDALKKNLNNEKIANYLIGSIALAKIPSLEASQYLEEIAESSPSLYKSASLTLGVLANKLSNTDRVESLKILDKRISNIKGLTDKNRLAVEFSAIGNMGLIESQKFLESYLAKSDSNMTSIILKSMRRNPDSRVNEIYLKTLSNSASEYLKENISFYLKQRSIANNGLNDLKDLIDAESNFNTKKKPYWSLC